MRQLPRSPYRRKRPSLKDVVSLAPYVSFGTSFRYNFTTHDDPPSPFTGTNNIQGGIALPIAISKNITVSPYAAYSYQWYGLVGTTPSTWWGGGSVTFSFYSSEFNSSKKHFRFGERAFCLSDRRSSTLEPARRHE